MIAHVPMMFANRDEHPTFLTDRQTIWDKISDLTRATTSRGIRSVLDPTISRRYPTNDRQLRYRRIPLEMYSDTMKESVRSRNGNKYAQVYCTRSGWTLAIPMQSKSDAHETLTLLFSRHGIPNILIVDGAKEQVQGKFKRKARQADCRLK